MNSIHRIGLTVAGVATALVVAGAFVVDGYTSAMATQNQAAADAATQAPATDSPSPEPLQPTIVYVRPAPTPTGTAAKGSALRVVGAGAANQPAPVVTPTQPAPVVTPTQPQQTPTQRPTSGRTFHNDGGGDD
jgi:hypothetical protein